MKQLWSIVWSSVGKKVIDALTGLALLAFVIIHLIGNLSLLRGDPGPFNQYAHFWEKLGFLLYLIEIGLIIVFLFHVVMGVAVWLDKRKARPEKYIKSANAGSPSKKTWSSKNMIISGLVLFVFTIVHLKNFKYGPGLKENYIYLANGQPIRDLYRLVVESFHSGIYVIGYTGAMVLLGFHLRHGFWSAFQSLGVQHPRLVPLIYAVGLLVAIVLAAGFIFLPVYIYFAGGVV
jgi:succinate dehydrogenase / fumarate reductase cytochrome b subunit